MFDLLYISFLNFLKPKFGRKAMPLALLYICFTEIAFYGLLASFFAAFANQMNIGNITTSKAVSLIIVVSLCICLKNWMRYNGKRRMILNAKSKKQKIQYWQLVVLPLICIGLTVILLQAV